MADNKKILYGSLALNIFLAAFVIARMNMLPPPPPSPPPPAMMADGHPMPLPPGGPMMGGPGPMGMPPFGPAEVLTPEEMQADAAHMHEMFDKVHDLRTSFARQLQQGSVTREDVLKHFAAVDGLMMVARQPMQQKMADKISAMSPEDRQKLAQRLLQ